MVDLNVTYSAIKEAENITDSIKENFIELITIFHNVHSDVDLSNFNDRIKTLKIKKASGFLTKIECEYVPKENILYVNPYELAEGDAKHGLMRSMLKIITAKDHFYGLNDNGKLEGINIGFTEIMADFLVGNESEKRNPNILEMQHLTRLITNIGVIDIESIKQGFFTNNSESVLNQMYMITENMDKVSIFLDRMNYNASAPKKGKNDAMEVQHLFVKLFATPENISNVKNLVITKPEAFDLNEENCPGGRELEATLLEFENKSLDPDSGSSYMKAAA